MQEKNNKKSLKKFGSLKKNLYLCRAKANEN